MGKMRDRVNVLHSSTFIRRGQVSKCTYHLAMIYLSLLLLHYIHVPIHVTCMRKNVSSR